MSAITTPPLDSTTTAPATNVAHAIAELRAHTPRPHPWRALLGFSAASLAAGALGAMVTRRRKNKLWYRLLRKPAFTPPDAVFGFVWPLLYAAASYSGYRVWKTPPSNVRSIALGAWAAQMACNAAWAPTFFGAHRPRAALWEVAGNFTSLGAYAAVASRVDRPAAALVAPYLGWLSFAAIMNGSIIRRNRWWTNG